MSPRRIGAVRAGSILCFHSLTTRDLPSANPVNIPLDLFERIVIQVKRCADIVSLNTLLDLHMRGQRTAGLVALTFDDGYVALLTVGADVIRRHKLPLTVFVTTEPATQGKPFWWDRVDEAFARAPARRWRQFEDDVGLPEEYRRGQPPQLGPLRPFRQWLLATNRGRWPAAFEQPLAQLEAEIGQTTKHRPMILSEIHQLLGLGTIDVGIHTHTHPVLPLLDDDELAEEITACHQRLRSWLPNPLPVLAVPFGLCDERTLRIAATAGMLASLSLAPRTVGSDVTLRGWPRFCIAAGESPLKLLLKMSGYFNSWLIRRAGWHHRFPDLPSPTT